MSPFPTSWSIKVGIEALTYLAEYIGRSKGLDLPRVVGYIGRSKGLSLPRGAYTVGRSKGLSLPRGVYR